MADKRFARVSSDPRFKKVDQKKRKVKIDSRFAGMFNDKAFTTKYFVDKRGAIIGKTSKENLRQFYDLSDDDIEEPENKFGKSKKKEKSKRKNDGNAIKKKKRKGNEQSTLLSNEEISNGDKQENMNDFQGHKTIDSSDDDNDIENDKISKNIIDLARGEGNFESSSSEEEYEDEDGDNAKAGSSILNQDSTQENDNTNYGYDTDTDTDDETEFQDDGIDHKWAELDSNIHRSNNITNRLAVCNLDWDKVTATDIFVLFSSIIKKGILKSVKIYLSDYGLERLKNEECYGPQEIIDGECDGDDTVEGSNFSREKLRQYQLNRLKYYYAVVECDSKETCNQIYEEFDGVEFELSGNLLDLRFIPNDIDLEQEPTSMATEMPSVTMYKPPEFETTALHQTNVKMTWDETDSRRLKTTMKAFKKEDLQDMDFQAYLASDDEDEGALDAGDGDDGGAEDEDENIAKYKKLLQDIDSKEHEDDNDNEMEITWEPGLNESAMNLVAKKRAEKEEKDLTAWEKYLNKKKEKKKERRLKEKEKRIKAKQNEEEYIPESVDFSDPFFAHEFGPDFPANNNEKVKTKLSGSKKKEKKGIETEEDKKRKEELELLLMDEKEEPKHFSLKRILENEKMSKKLKKRRRELERVNEDPFKVDVEDSRFSALYSSHHYAINPSDPHYRKTKAMDAIFEERQRRRELKAKQTEEQDQNIKQTVSQNEDGKPSRDPSLSLLVKSVKSKTGEFNQRRKKHKTKY